jgi:nitroimidazol reductase NimA-like FMN-containing flavoprotein (pyridoxamine 5'-phosphate oxidase superfamily)
MPRLTDDEFDAFLAEPGHLVRIATVDDDGLPRVVPLWFVRVDDELFFTPRTPAILHRNLRRDHRLGLSVDEDALPYRKVTVQGTARLVHGPGHDDEWRELYRTVAGRYIARESADAYVDGTADQPRALYAVSLNDPSKVTSWRMPMAGEDPTSIWAKRYYVPGSR